MAEKETQGRPGESQGAGPSKVVSFLSGVSSGATVGAIVQPLDVIRTRIQADKAIGIQRSLWGTIRVCLKEGGIRSLWSGTTATVLRLSMGAGMYFVALETIKSVLQPLSRGRMTAKNAAIAGGVSRTFSTTILCPLTVIKTRMEYTAANYQHQYSSVVNAVQRIVAVEGVSGLWRGLIPTLLSSTPFSMLYFTFYSQLKQNFDVQGVIGNFSVGLIAGTCATLITQPMDVVRTRLQLGIGGDVGTYGVLQNILQKEGFVGLLTGTSPRVVKRTLQTALIWTIYEEIMPQIQRLLSRESVKLS